jgi:predicted RNA-binding protein with PIN domain
MQETTHLYCIDGNNLVRGAFGYGGPEFQAQEDADAQRLIKALERTCLLLGSRIDIEVFFDGPFRAHLQTRAQNLSVRFTRETKADDIIIDRVRSRSYAGTNKVTVVTGDTELGERVRRDGGRWQKIMHGASLESVISVIENRFSRRA